MYFLFLLRLFPISEYLLLLKKEFYFRLDENDVRPLCNQLPITLFYMSHFLHFQFGNHSKLITDPIRHLTLKKQKKIMKLIYVGIFLKTMKTD